MIDESSLVCCFCECPVNTHCFFVKCPLFMDESICIDCCHHDIEKEEAEGKLVLITRVERTRDAINKICAQCGKRGI